MEDFELNWLKDSPGMSKFLLALLREETKWNFELEKPIYTNNPLMATLFDMDSYVIESEFASRRVLTFPLFDEHLETLDLITLIRILNSQMIQLTPIEPSSRFRGGMANFDHHQSVIEASMRTHELK